MTNSAEIARLEPVLLAALRIVAGVLFLSHGLVKLFGFPPGAAPGRIACTLRCALDVRALIVRQLACPFAFFPAS